MQAAPNPGYTFTGFGGGLTGTLNPQNLTLSAATSVTASFSAILAATDLSITSSHTGTFLRGQNNAFYLLRVSNAAAAAATSGTVTVTENPPAGLTVTSMSGQGWNCSGLSCTRSDALAGSSGYPSILVLATVSGSAPTSLTNQATVSGGGDTNETNNTASDVTAVAANGYPVAWGDNRRGQVTVPAGLSNLVQISGGYFHSLALRSDGTVLAWGDNEDSQTAVPSGLSGVVAVAAGWYHSLALKNDGTVVAWGDNGNGQATVPAGLSGVVAIAAGGFHSLALKSDGTVVAWGYNGYGQATVPADLSGAVAIAGSYLQSLALKSDGTVVSWGIGYPAVPSGLSNVVAIAAGDTHDLALISDGTVVAWGNQSAPAGLSGVTAIAAGGYHSLALKNDGTVVAWGDNSYGQATVPSGLTGAIALAAGAYDSLAISSFAPTTIPVTIATSGFSGTVTVDGTPYANTPIVLDWMPGSSHTIGTTSLVAIDPNSQSVFASWSDGGAITHTVAPMVATTYTAIFQLQYKLTTSANPPAGGTVAPASGFFNAGGLVQIAAAPNPGYEFSGFSGGLTGTITPQNLNLSAPTTVTGSFVPANTPIISGLNPSVAIAGGASFTLTVSGRNFTSGSTVTWGNTALATTFVNANQLSAVVPANLIATPGTAGITVTTSIGTSIPMTFAINQDGIGWITQSLPYGVVSTPYSTQIVAQGNNVTFSTTSPLPSGFTLSPTGLLSGTTRRPSTPASM